MLGAGDAATTEELPCHYPSLKDKKHIWDKRLNTRKQLENKQLNDEISGNAYNHKDA